MPVSALIQSILTQIHSGQFMKATLSKAASQEAALNVYLKPIRLKDTIAIAATYRYKTRDEVKNYSPKQLGDLLNTWLSGTYREAVFFTNTAEITLKANKKGAYAVFEKQIKSVTPTQATQEHNRAKARLLDPAAAWLRAIGITTAQGEVRADAQDKWRQMNKYLEIIASLLDTTPLKPNARIVDMGAGKGYLTFALADYLTTKYDFVVEIIGVELRTDLVDFCNRLAQKEGFTHLSFLAKDIAEVQKQKMDILIALHACDTATDLAIYAGMAAKANIIVVAPCCHKQVRRDMVGSEQVSGIMGHGILLERQAEILTDSIRSLLLESLGYKTKVFEFISVEHTPKNVLITAEKRSAQPTKQAKALQTIDALKQTFGLKKHFLEGLIEKK
jgi:Methyltransferase domain